MWTKVENKKHENEQNRVCNISKNGNIFRLSINELLTQFLEKS